MTFNLRTFPDDVISELFFKMAGFCRIFKGSSGTKFSSKKFRLKIIHGKQGVCLGLTHAILKKRQILNEN